MARLDPTRDTINLKNIDQLDPATLIANSDKLIVFQSGTTRSATLSQVFGQFASSAQLLSFENSVTAQIANMVTTIGTQTLTGDKTFAGAIAVPTPSAASHAVTKLYVDDRDAQNQKLTGDQAIAGVKTFATPPILSADPTNNNHAARKVYVDNLDFQNVKLTGDQNLGGLKVFALPPIVPTPTDVTRAANKGYVDALDVANVKLTGAQTLAGIKTFSSVPVLPSSDPVNSNDATRKSYVDSMDAQNVKLTGAQTISGVKTFSALPQSAVTPTALDQLTRKGYVDDRDALYMPLAGGTFTGLITVPVATLAGHPVRKDMFDTLGVRAANSYIQNAVANPRAVVTMTAVAHPSGTFSLAPSGSSGQEIEYVLPTIASTSVGHTLIFARWGVGASNFFVSAGGAANILDAQYLFATLSGNAARLVVVRLRNEWFVVSYSGGVTFTA
jgi:hypothetical protein